MQVRFTCSTMSNLSINVLIRGGYVENDLMGQALQVFIIVFLTFVLSRITRKACHVIEAKQLLPASLLIPLAGFLKWAIRITGLLFVLEAMGMPLKSLWTGLISVLLLLAVAFFAVWSVLSNILCAALLLAFSRARIGDIVELRDTKQDEVGLRGRIIDINLFYVTLQELKAEESVSSEPAVTQVPCHLFFYRVVRRWQGSQTQPLANAFSEIDKTP